MFVRTHVAFYFVSLLLSDILQGESLFVHSLTRAHSSWMPSLTCPHLFAAISSIMNSAWLREGAVVYGSLCTAQGGHCSLFT